MSSSPEGFTGRIIVIAKGSGPADKADYVADILSTVAKKVKAGDEPGTLTYRPTRYENEFVIFEEYTDAAAVQAHNSSPEIGQLIELAKAGVLKLELKFYSEL